MLINSLYIYILITINTIGTCMPKSRGAHELDPIQLRPNFNPIQLIRIEISQSDPIQLTYQSNPVQSTKCGLDWIKLTGFILLKNILVT